MAKAILDIVSASDPFAVVSMAYTFLAVFIVGLAHLMYND
jgi:hypothetical protein